MRNYNIYYVLSFGCSVSSDQRLDPRDSMLLSVCVLYCLFINNVFSFWHVGSFLCFATVQLFLKLCLDTWRVIFSAEMKLFRSHLCMSLILSEVSLQ